MSDETQAAQSDETKKDLIAWHTKSETDVMQELHIEVEKGLSSDEAEARQEKYGLNELEERGLRSPWVVLAGQFTEIMVLILIVAAAISFLIGETTDAIMILIIVILNAILGFTQEYRAEKAMEALKKLSVPTVKVRRDGQIKEVEAKGLVPGDVVMVEAGDLIPADGRIAVAATCEVAESALTGESAPVPK